ncbi:MAG: hypothetical protein PVJ25_07445 [Desulfuromonadales bacterium]|jgi:hypothetical protein
MCGHKKIHARELAIGPLVYHLYAFDQWGADILDGIGAHLSCNAMTQNADRKILLFDDNPTAFSDPGKSDELSIRDVAADSWQLRKNLIDTTWRSSRSDWTFWSAGVDASIGPVRFHLPWTLVIDDLVALGGGLIHAGLVNHRDSGYVFTAPPSGGKSTTLRTAPSNWRVMSDDAALVWPAGHHWLASPLPSWGDQLRPDEPWSWPQMKLDATCKITHILQLEKGDQINLVKQAPSTATASIYRALSEYPVTILANTGYREESFRSAAHMARDLSTWQLTLPKHGDIWSLLTKEMQ